ncbi:MAG: response regulator [Polyangiaceae bacterium]
MDQAVLVRTQEIVVIYYLGRMCAGPRSATLLHRMRVLLLEDEESLAGAVQRALVRDGMKVTVTRSVDDAIAALAAAHFDVVLADVHLGSGGPLREGLDLVRHVKRVGGPPVIVYTGSQEHGLVRDALLAGAVDCLFKDRIDPVGLAKTLRTLATDSGPGTDVP